MRHYLRSLFLLALTGSVLQVLESNAMAQGYYGPPPGYYRPAPRYVAPSYYPGGQLHDGLFVRGTVGMGYLTASESSGGVSQTLSGFGARVSQYSPRIWLACAHGAGERAHDRRRLLAPMATFN
jgi:hypothetical protein